MRSLAYEAHPRGNSGGTFGIVKEWFTYSMRKITLLFSVSLETTLAHWRFPQHTTAHWRSRGGAWWYLYLTTNQHVRTFRAWVLHDGY